MHKKDVGHDDDDGDVGDDDDDEDDDGDVDDDDDDVGDVDDDDDEVKVVELLGRVTSYLIPASLTTATLASYSIYSIALLQAMQY